MQLLSFLLRSRAAERGNPHHESARRHRQYRHPIKRGRVTIAGKPGDDFAKGTMNSMLKQAQWKR